MSFQSTGSETFCRFYSVERFTWRLLFVKFFKLPDYISSKEYRLACRWRPNLLILSSEKFAQLTPNPPPFLFIYLSPIPHSRSTLTCRFPSLNNTMIKHSCLCSVFFPIFVDFFFIILFILFLFFLLFILCLFLKFLSPIYFISFYFIFPPSL